NLIQIIIIGCLGYYIASFLDFAGLQYVSAGLERLILFVYPTLVLLMTWQIFGQQISRNQWLAVGVTYCGIILAFAGEYNLTDSFSNQGDDHLFTGAMLIVGCALAYAGYIVGSSRLIPKTGASLFNSLSMVAASIGILFHFFVFSNSDLQQITTQAWKYGLLMAVFATVIPSYLIAESIKRIGGENTAIIASIGPVSTILMAYWWLGEPITIWQILGTVCILAGVWMISGTGKKPE
ncbi:MAG: DMT family transporter, partial [Cyclobacteriaceae bacterium]